MKVMLEYENRLKNWIFKFMLNEELCNKYFTDNLHEKQLSRKNCKNVFSDGLGICSIFQLHLKVVAWKK